MDDELYGWEKSWKDYKTRVFSGCFWSGVGLSLVVGGLVCLAFGDCGCEKKVDEDYFLEEKY